VFDVRNGSISAQYGSFKVQHDIIQAQVTHIDAQDETIADQETQIAATSVPITNSDKILTIYLYGEGYKLSANSYKPQKHFLIRFTFPASMNYKQELNDVI
jgi:hypothetical protein